MSRGRLLHLFAIAALAAFPLAGGPFYVELVGKVMILAIFAMSLDLLVGTTGLVSFGHAAYYGIGAYALALLAPRYDAANLWATLPRSILAAALAALVVGALVVRVKGVYFIMVTLAFAQMAYFVFHDTDLGGGSDGLSMSFRPVAQLGPFAVFDVSNPRHVYWFILAAMVAVAAFIRIMLRSPLGRALEGIRSNEHRMRSLGFSVPRYKLASFTIAGGLAGLAGYLLAMQGGFVNPELISWHQSGNALVMVILGGRGRAHAGIVGAFVFVALQELFQSLTTHWQLPFGAAIILLVMLLPGGVLGGVARLEAALAARAARRRGAAGLVEEGGHE
ncbi:MAG TPA: branched-chain amino acid ABC transporter permease [Anaeromyxobacter sp.]